MRFIAARDLRNNPGKVQELLNEGDLVLTAKGKPVAVIVPAGEDLEELILLLRRARAQLALSRIRREAAATGVGRISLKEADEEIRQVRAHRSKAHAKKTRRTA